MKKVDITEQKIFEIVESLKNFLPDFPDRTRLSFLLYKYMKLNGETPEQILRDSHFLIRGISEEELLKIIQSKLALITPE